MADEALTSVQRPPGAARVVVIGGGIVGCSIAYHLSELGWNDVVLLEQGRLTSGTTWHAAGLVGQLRAHASMTRLIRYSTDLYARLETETGLATGWKQCGSLAVARTADRMVQLARTAATARAQDVACDLLTPAEAGALFPLMETADLHGGVWLPGDGKANPADLTMALAKGARNRGVRIFEGVTVTGATRASGEAGRRRIAQVDWRAKDGATGTIDADTIVLAAGQWSRALGRQLFDATVPLFSCEHFYIVTDRIAGVSRDLPVMRDPDGYIYFKEEVGGFLMGGFEPDATPWLQSAQHRGGIPPNFEFQLLPDNWDAFQVLMENAIVRVPALGEAAVKQFVNGPESFTADNNFILGPAPGLSNLWVACGFNSMGIASAGGAGKALAEWIVQGEPTLDLWPVDLRRFARFNGNEQWLPDRIKEVLGMHYRMPWPNRELESARPFRRSPLYEHLRAGGACFGSKMGWERANFFAPSPAEAAIEYGWGQQNWHAWSAAEHHACRERVALFDMSSFAKLLVSGPDARAVLDGLIANDVPTAGRTCYTPLLNERGGYESDFTVTHLADDRYLIVSGSAQAVRDLDLIERALSELPAGTRCQVADVTSQWAMLAVMGPRSRELLQRVSTADLSSAAFAFGASREIDIGYATVRATRLTYVGELGWELYVPVEFAVGVYEELEAAGSDLGMADAGYYAVDSLRLEMGYRAWGRELGPDIDPYEAGLAFAVAFDKPAAFRGKAALHAKRTAGGARAARRRVVSLVVDAPHTMLWGGELILRDGEAVGSVTSAAFGHTLGAPVALGIVSRTDAAIDADWLAAPFTVDVAGERYAAHVTLKAPRDASAARA